MKKLLFSAVSLDVGGIETALVTLLNYLASQKENDKYSYEISLVLERKQGLFLESINKNIKILEFTPNNSKIVLFRKAVNFIKQQLFKRKYGNKYDFSCCYATYSNSGAFVARTASKNSALWCHLDYLSYFKYDKQSMKKFFNEKHCNEFSHIIFVSEESKDTFLKVFPELKDNTQYINNLIDYNKVINLSKEKVNDIREEKEIVTFLNMGRHDENQKKLSRIIEATKKLKKSTNKKFRVLFVGDGENTSEYKELTKKYGLDEEILFVGRKKNPYPYLKMADCIILSSDYEGYPVVFVESMILDKPIITTKVSGTEAIQKEGYAIITDKDSNSISTAMEEFMKNGFYIEKKFNPEQYNNEILEKLNKIIYK